MELDENTKHLAHDVFEAIKKEKEIAYRQGYGKGIDVGRKSSKIFAPEPCTIFKGKITIKDFFQKINEEVDELKAEILNHGELDDSPLDIAEGLYPFSPDEEDRVGAYRIAEEGADVCTAVTSLLEARRLNINVRNEAQRRVNERNKERGRW